MEAEGAQQDLRSFLIASPSPEIKDVDAALFSNHTHPSVPRNSQNPNWRNPISGGLEDLASSMGRLSLSPPVPLFVDQASSQRFKFADTGQFSVNNTLQDSLCLPNPSMGTINSCVSHNGIRRLGSHGHYELDAEQFLQRRSFSSLEDVKGQMGSLAQVDQRGCLLGKPAVIEMILWQVKDHFCDLMMDQHSSYLIQIVFEASSVEQKTRILSLVIRNEHKLKEVCMHNHGTRSIQKFLEHLKTPEQISTAVFALKRITVRLSKSINGGYVIQQCLKLFSPALTKFILDEVTKNCVEIASDKSGCSLFQKCLHHAKGDAMRRLIEEIVSYALVLAEHPYGNYVVQYVVKMKIAQVNSAIISRLRGKYVQLSMNKHASNVVEDLLEFSEESDAAIIVQEIMYNRNFLGILQDPYGNYVVQRALKNCKGTLNKILSSSILSNYPHLHSHLYGKRVLAFVKARKICV
ncbi:pumilio homolog 12-like [Abrus precatorius]|uniref:Pumilio homolog 12-like n=1 Tax=Abrus precatorius TaxID=3816 RepID=A0A8B8LY04_ABRPR|nr:pumilio homolog 12-like [Abrus precatorius]